MTGARGVMGLGVAWLGATLVLVTGVLGDAAAGLRVGLALWVVVVAPGFALLAILRATPPGGAWLAAGWAFALGVSWNAAVLAGTLVLGLRFTVLGGAGLALTAALIVAAGVTARHAPSVAPAPSAAPALSGPSIVIVMTAAALAVVCAAYFGAPLGLFTDSPDHIGTIRRMLDTGRAFPRDAFFLHAGAAGIDPRKGMWHPQVALVTSLARVDPEVAWRFLPSFIAPLLVLNGAAFGVLLGGSTSAAFAAAGILLLYGGTPASRELTKTVYASKLADHLAMVTAIAVLRDLRSPSRRARITSAVMAFGATAVHVFAAVQFAIVFGALGLGLWVRDRAWKGEVRRLVGTALAVGLASAPFVIWQVLRSPAPRNVIHTQPQGLLWLSLGFPVISPGVVWDWLGPAWLLFPLFLITLWRHGRRNAASLYLFTTPIAVALTIFDPWLVGPVSRRAGYLLMRTVWMVPLFALVAWLVPHLWRRIAAGSSAGGRRGAVLGLALTCVLLFGPVADAVHVSTRARAIARADRAAGVDAWRDALQWMKRTLPDSSVVLADPATSYTIPMVAGLHVVCMEDQHSSPSDSDALRRILDARDALDPWADWTAMRRVVRRYGVTAIALNNRFVEAPTLDYWSPGPTWFAAARRRLDARPDAFRRRLDAGEFVVYEIDGAVLDTLSIPPPPPRPFVHAWSPRAGITRHPDPGLPGILTASLSRRIVTPGDSLHGIILWRATDAVGPGAYQVAVRFDRNLPGGLHPPDALRKPVRKIVEKLARERYRFREMHLPVGGRYGVDLWQPDEVVRDSFAMRIPNDVAEGVYDVRVRMLQQAHYPNFRVRDYFHDDDVFSGIRVARLIVARDPAHVPALESQAGGSFGH